MQIFLSIYFDKKIFSYFLLFFKEREHPKQTKNLIEAFVRLRMFRSAPDCVNLSGKGEKAKEHGDPDGKICHHLSCVRSWYEHKDSDSNNFKPHFEFSQTI